MTQEKKQSQSVLKANISLGRVSITDRAVFIRHLAVMLKSGLSLHEALEIAHDSARGRLKKAVGKLATSVSAGNSLSASFSQHPKIFPAFIVNVTKAGEQSGTLEENLENIAMQLQKEQRLQSKIKGAMTYPVVVLVAAFILGLAMAYYVLPQITPLFTGLKIELPFTTRVVIAVSDIIRAHGVWLFPVIIFGVVFLVWLARKKFAHPVTHWLLLHIPILKEISRGSNLTRFNLTLGTLLKSGLNIDEALKITQATLGNYYYRKALQNASQRVQHGSTVSENLQVHSHLFPKLVTSMIRVGEKSGRLDETLLYLSDFYETEVDASTKNLTTAIEPVLLIVIGVVVATLALAIITPIYEITGNIRR